MFAGAGVTETVYRVGRAVRSVADAAVGAAIAVEHAKLLRNDLADLGDQAELLALVRDLIYSRVTRGASDHQQFEAEWRVLHNGLQERSGRHDPLSRLSKELRALVGSSGPHNFSLTLGELDKRLMIARELRDRLLERVLCRIRPIERSFRLASTFFDAATEPERLERPLTLWIFDSDGQALAGDAGARRTLAALERFCKLRNDSFNARDIVSALVLPAFVPYEIQESVEQICARWGMLHIGSLADEPSLETVASQFQSWGRYGFMQRPAEPGVHTVAAGGYVELRPPHPYEKGAAADGLYGSPSLALAGMLARTAGSRGLAGAAGNFRGIRQTRFELSADCLRRLTVARPFFVCRPSPDEGARFHPVHAIAGHPFHEVGDFSILGLLHYIENRCRQFLNNAAGQILTASLIEDWILRPIGALLDQMRDDGLVSGHVVTMDKTRQKLVDGVCDISVSVRFGGREFVLALESPRFRPDPRPQGGKN